jgi:hypothetical protein
MARQALLPALALLCSSLAACGGGSATRRGTAAQAVASAAARVAGCPVTLPNGRTPPGEQPSREDHGNGALWTGLPPDGTIVAGRPFVRPDGSMRIKFPWWGSLRADAELNIISTSLHPRGRVARSTISPGLTGAPHFWASAIIFPSDGCWRVAASAGHASLTFVVRVVRDRAA